MKEMNKKQISHPTGFVTTALPFWEKLDDGKFEQFCTDWLNFHPSFLCHQNGKTVMLRVVSATRLLSGTTQRGADIRAELQNGEIWWLQCKLVKEFHLSDVQEAIKLAETQNPSANRYVLITSCGLSDKAQQEIESHAKWVWWDSSRLTTEVQKIDPVESGMKLVHRFFGTDYIKLLFPWGSEILLTWQEYFAQDLSIERRLFHHRGEFLIWGDVLVRLRAFAINGSGRALVLSGGGGQGKSRLLLELAKELESKVNAPRVRFLRVSGKGLDAESLDLISREKNLLLIVEDAHRLDAALGQIAMAMERAENVRLLIATRPQAREAAFSELARNGYGERLEPALNLPRWKQADIQALAEKVLSPNHQLEAPHLASIADRCPLLVVLGGALINKGTIPQAMTNEVLFREKVFKGFQDEFLRHHDGQRSVRLRRLIRLLAFISPTPKNDALFTRAGETLECSALDVADDLEALQNAGLIAENKEGIRIYPDLFSDSVLLDACLNGSGQMSLFCNTIVETLPASDFPSLLRNLAQADWEVRTKRGANNSFFDPVWLEFANRFDKANWNIRRDMLHQWAPFALFQPERTLELAQCALKASNQKQPDENILDESNYMLQELPAILKPLVMWHKPYANEALDILWSLKTTSVETYSSPIGTISSAASFGVHKHFGSEAVLAWLENHQADSAFTERIMEQPSILVLVLKPYFAHVVEQSWREGNAISFRGVPLLPQAIRSLRKRALILVERFATSDIPEVARYGIQVLEQTICPINFCFGYRPGVADYKRWQQDRLEAVDVIQRVIDSISKSHSHLLQIRKFLSKRAEYDPDEIVRNRCQDLFLKIPDSFELRIARVLASWSHEEYRLKSGPDFDANYREAERKWGLFCRQVAEEASERFRTAGEVAMFLKSEMGILSAAGFTINPYTFVSSLAELSSKWASSLLKELSTTDDGRLGSIMSAVLSVAISNSPESYRNAILEIPIGGRPEQVCSLINFLGSKRIHQGVLTPQEQETIESCVNRKESTIVKTLAYTLGLQFSEDVKWASTQLSNLKELDNDSASAVVQALGQIVEKHGRKVEPGLVAECLENIGPDFCYEGELAMSDFGKISKEFPVVVYEYFRSFLKSGSVKGASIMVRLAWGGLPPLGKITDQAYIKNEIHKEWELVKMGDSTQVHRLGLIRALIWSESASTEIYVNEIILSCESGDQLLHAAELVAVAGSQFVFQHPSLVKMLLSRGEGFRVEDKVRKHLWRSACGGGRSYSDNQLDEQYRYIRSDAEKLAAAYSADLVLSSFYKMIVKSEDHEIEMHKRIFPSIDEDAD